jgi:hypothetical protein
MKSNDLHISQTLNAPLSIVIQKTYNALRDAVSKIDTDSYCKKNIEWTSGKVSSADIIAYQIGWGTALLEWYHAGIANRKIEMPGHGFSTWDYAGLAAYFYQKYGNTHPHEQLKQFHDVVQKIISIIEKEYETGNLEKIGVWQWCTLKSGKAWPLSKWVQVNTVAPYKRAVTSLKKIKKI